MEQHGSATYRAVSRGTCTIYEDEQYANYAAMLAAAVGKLNEVVIVGYEADGSFYFASTRASGPDTLWLLAQAQRRLLEISE